jgi:hypothetical protein
MFSINTFVEGRPLKITSWFTLSLFSWVFYLSPNAFAVNEKITQQDKRQVAIEQALDANPEQAFVRRLQKLKDLLSYELPREKAAAEKARQQETLGKMQSWLSQYGVFELPVLTEEQRQAIVELRDEIKALKAESDKGFDEIGEHILNHPLPKVALERHQAVLKEVDSRFATFNQKIDALLAAPDREAEEKALLDLSLYIEQQQFSKSHDKTNLEKLPFGIPDKAVRKQSGHAALSGHQARHVGLLNHDRLAGEHQGTSPR